MQLKDAKSGLENKFVSVKPINLSRKTHFQVAKNLKFFNCQTVITFATCKNCQTVKKNTKITDLIKLEATYFI